MSFFEFCSRRTQQTTKLNLNASQRKRLLSDQEARAALQNERMVSLLPPVGTEVFRRFTPASLEEIQRKQEAQGERKKKTNKEQEENQHVSKPANQLQAGKTLPFIFGDTPPELLSIPLEDLDPFYQSQKTFMVLSKDNSIHRFNAESACYLLSPFSSLRTTSIKILLHPLFRLFILLTLLINFVFMLIEEPGIRRVGEWVFLSVYIGEVIFKLLSRGFCMGRFTFIRDPWNWLDIFIIIHSLEALLLGLSELSALGTIPRVMKIFTCSTGLKKTVEGVVQSVKRLGGTVALTTFCLIIMTMIGLQLFMGNLRQKCVFMNPEKMFPKNDSEVTGVHFDYHKHITDGDIFHFHPGSLDATVCGNTSDSGVCPDGATCVMMGRSPNYGYTNYDSFWSSLLSVLRLLTHDFWDNLLMLTMRSAGKHSIIYFVLIFFPTCFLVLSIIMAVVAMAQVEREEADAAEAGQRGEELSRIIEVLRSREEESRGAGLSEEPEPVSVAGGEEDGRASCCSGALPVLTGDCCGCSRWLQQKLRPFVHSPNFDLVIAICIIGNIVLMAAERYPMTESFAEILAISELVFLAIFTAEMLLKLVALGLRGYFKVRRNIFDCVLVVLSLLELGLDGVKELSVLQLVWLLRALRLERWWPDLQLLLRTVWTSVGSLSLVLLLVVFMFSVVGLQLFQKDYKDCVCRITTDCELPRWHMADFFHSFLVVIKGLAGQWVELLWDCMEVSNEAVCLIYFMSVLIIGKLLLLILFLNLLLSSFSNSKLAAAPAKGSNTLLTKGNQRWTWIRKHIRTLQGYKTIANPGLRDSEENYLALTIATHKQPRKAPAADADVLFQSLEKDKEESPFPHAEVQKGNTPEDCCCDGCYRCCTILNVDTSQGVGKVWSTFRTACFHIVRHKVFEIVIIFIILLSSAVLVFEDIYLEHRPILQMVLNKADLVFTFVFLMEMFLKWIAFGFKKYFSDFWCWIDFLILDVSLISLVADMMGFSTQPLRALRALRTLRTPARFKGMKVVLRSMVLNFPSMLRALLVSLFVWLLFSILGVNLFAGKFFYCFNETSEEFFSKDIVNNKSQCLELIMPNFTEVRWKNMVFNFDNVGMGFLSLLLMATSAGSFDVLYAAADSGMVEDQPVYKSNIFMKLYFVLFGIIGCFFTWNFFIGVFIDSLQRHRNQMGGKHVFMTEEQQKHSRTLMEKFSRKPARVVPRPQSCCPARLFDLATAPWLEVVMVIVICVGLLLLMLDNADQSHETHEILAWFHFVLLIIFLVEFILKIIALRKHYFSSCLNILDSVALLLSIVGLFFADILYKYFVGPSLFSVLRLGRVIRALLNIRWAGGIRKLLLAVLMTLPALRNIGLLYFLLLFTYSYLGMCSFAHVKKQAALDDMYNFETFGNSIISMILVGTASSWDGFLYPFMLTPPDCDPAIGDCGNPTAGIIFYSSYILLYILLMVHAFVTVILGSFNSRDLEGGLLLSDRHLQMFYHTWTKFDPTASQVIQYSELSDFCNALQDPLRIPKPNTIRLTLMNVPLLAGDKVRCLDILHAVVEQVFGGSEQKDALKARLEEKFTVNNPSKVSQEPISSTLRRKQEEVAAAVIQRAFRKHHLQEQEGGGASGGSSAQ